MPAMSRLRFAGATLLTALAWAEPAQAHGASAWPDWTLDPWVTLPLALSLLWFNVGYLRLRARERHPGVHRRHANWFWLGWLVLAGALVSPLHAAGERSFAAHMFEHELLMLAAAPLLVLARPVGVALWALPPALRMRCAAVGRNSAFAGTWRTLTDPLIATLLQATALWLWHAPRLFDLALAQPGWHVAQHLSFLLSALLFWTAVIDARRARPAMAIGCLFFTATISGALGAFMALSSSPWYDGYAALGMAPFGWTPAEDQQFAGLLMWIPGGLVHALAALVLLARSLRERAAETSP
jgi:cytochrome c oxidase assembly factor CtaG